MFPSDAEWGMAMRDDWGLPQIARSNTDAMRGAFIKNTDITDAHGSVFSGSFTLAPRPTAWFLMRRRRDGSPRIFRMRSETASVQI